MKKKKIELKKYYSEFEKYRILILIEIYKQSTTNE